MESPPIMENRPIRKRIPVFRLVMGAGLGMALLFHAGCREMVQKEAGEKMRLARLAMEEENWEAADDLFHEVLLLDQSKADAWVGRAMSLTHLDEVEAARAHYEAALIRFEQQLDEDPADAVALRKLIMVLVLLNRSGEAMEVSSTRAHPKMPPDILAGLPKLIDSLREEHAGMILPPKDPAASGLFSPLPLP